MQQLTVLYDEACPLCVRCQHWLADQPAYVAIELLPCGSAEVQTRYGAVPWLGAELVVVNEEGDVWVGPAAFLMCLWALRSYRGWSYRLSDEAFAPLAERFFHAISQRRSWVASLLPPPAACPGGTCRASSHAPGHYR